MSCIDLFTTCVSGKHITSHLHSLKTHWHTKTRWCIVNRFLIGSLMTCWRTKAWWCIVNRLLIGRWSFVMLQKANPQIKRDCLSHWCLEWERPFMEWLGGWSLIVDREKKLESCIDKKRDTGDKTKAKASTTEATVSSTLHYSLHSVHTKGGISDVNHCFTTWWLHNWLY